MWTALNVCIWLDKHQRKSCPYVEDGHYNSLSPSRKGLPHQIFDSVDLVLWTLMIYKIDVRARHETLGNDTYFGKFEFLPHTVYLHRSPDQTSQGILRNWFCVLWTKKGMYHNSLLLTHSWIEGEGFWADVMHFGSSFNTTMVHPHMLDITQCCHQEMNMQSWIIPWCDLFRTRAS